MAGQLKKLQKAEELQAEEDGAHPAADDELEAQLLLTALEARFGADCFAYDRGWMRTRLDAFVASRCFDSVSVLQGRILRDDRLGAELIQALNRSSSSLCDVFSLMALRCAIVPLLRSSPWPAIWIADCCDVRVPVLLLALLAEERLLERTRVFITCSSEQALAGMRRLALSGSQVDALQLLHRRCGGTAPLTSFVEPDGDGGFVPRQALRDAASAHVHHLASDASFREFHAIVAPRPLCEYGPELARRAIGVFGASLCAFGVLQVDESGGRRTGLPGEAFDPVLKDYGIYRKAG